MKKLAILSAGIMAIGLPAHLARADDAEMIKNAEMAAPASIASEAAVLAPQADGSIKTLREGKNGYWCIPDDPNSPGNDPMCGDANAMEWAAAWMGHKDPPKDKVGFIFMLAGASDASNTDPFATKPAAGMDWMAVGPHVMVMNAMDKMAGYPGGEHPDITKPFVMWEGTPYAHLMVPVQ